MRRSELPSIALQRPARFRAFTPESTRERLTSALARFDPSIRAAKTESGEIEIFGEIGESFWSDNFTTVRMVKDQLKALGKAPALVSINSFGGDAFEGVAIYNVLREHPGAVTVQVIGMAASAASIIAMAGDTVKMGKAAMMMIHSAASGLYGNQQDLRALADILQAVDESVAGLYAARTGMKGAEILSLMEKETYMSADAAIKDGFADSMMADKVKASMSARKPVYLHGPKAPVPRVAGAVYLK